MPSNPSNTFVGPVRFRDIVRSALKKMEGKPLGASRSQRLFNRYRDAAYDRQEIFNPFETIISLPNTSEEFLAALVSRGYISASEYVVTPNDVLLSSEHVFDCQRCNCASDSRESHPVKIKDDRGRTVENVWCDNCRSNYAFFCDWTGNNYSVSHFQAVTVDNNSTVCLEANDGDLFYWDSDDQYHSEVEPESSEDDPFEDTSDDSYGIISGYHNQRRSWEDRAPTGDVLGCELEILCPDSRSDTLRAVRDVCREHNFLAERDGSLHADKGVEMVAPPMTLAATQAADGAWAKILKKCRSLGCASWNAKDYEGRKGGYGMHVNINRSSFSELIGAKTVAFINENKSLGELIAGRGCNRWAKYQGDKRKYLVHDINSPSYTGRRSEKWKKKIELRNTDKYEAASVRPGRIEVRIFRGTLKFSSFLKNVEYCAAVVAFAKVALLCEMTEANFLSYVARQRLVYPNLANFLEENSKIRKPRKGTLVGVAADSEDEREVA